MAELPRADVAGSRYEAREFPPGAQMFDQGYEDHCWAVFDTKEQKAIPGEGMLEADARRRAQELNSGKRKGVRYTYSFEVDLDGKWFCPPGMQDIQLSFLRGYAMGRRDTPAPSRAMRIVRSDGKVMEGYAANTEVDIGLVAGWPTPEQYEAAAERALQTAGRIRQANKRREL